MQRPHRRPPNKRKLSPLLVAKAKPARRAYLVWDTHQRGLALRVEPTGFRSYKCIYSHAGRTRWYSLGAADAIGLADARKLAARVMLQVFEGTDPQAERKAQRGAGTFEELAERYREFAQRRNKSWRQADALVRKHCLPRWAKLPARDIARADVRGMLAKIDSRTVANQVLASASALFSWALREEYGGVTVNPCARIERHATRSRERVLLDNELPRFWAAFDSAGLVTSTALKMILLTGQRPGEVLRMRREHIVDGWWTMPGAPVPALGWVGTKNAQTHRVWLPQPAQALIAELDEPNTGFVFAGPRGRPTDNFDAAMREICKTLGVERATPHDLRRTHGTMITAMGFGRALMNRIQNHREGGIGDVCDRHEYGPEMQRTMEAVAAGIVQLAEGGPEAGNVVQGRFDR